VKQSKKNRKQNEKFLEAKQSEIRPINFALVGSEKFEAKRSENKYFFHVSVRNGSRFTLKRKFFFAKPAHPS
jgi:hypothetical protein